MIQVYTYSTIYPYKSSHDVIEAERDRDEKDVGINKKCKAIKNTLTTKRIENKPLWNQSIEAVLWTILAACSLYLKRKQKAIEVWKQLRKNRYRQLILRGCGREIEEVPQIVLSKQDSY